ncbi:hypothetical protein [Actinomyces ruminis]|uniref:hypothetical protein n=1 Tax=Actinomyces ruminis TaxID=1937003 RepID=UPI000B6E472A|nr:hypothetical protein [Actinomyces ruminis]
MNPKYAPLTIYDSGADGELTDAARRFWNDRFKRFSLFIVPFTNVVPGGIGFESPNAFESRHLATLKEYADIAHARGRSPSSSSPTRGCTPAGR